MPSSPLAQLAPVVTAGSSKAASVNLLLTGCRNLRRPAGVNNASAVVDALTGDYYRDFAAPNIFYHPGAMNQDELI